MSGWVHTEHKAGRGWLCYAAVQTGETPTPCGCTELVPTITCEWTFPTGVRCGAGEDIHKTWPHGFQPECRTCGHPIEERA